MSDDKKIERGDSDGLAELMDAFGGYVEEEDSEITIQADTEQDDYALDEITVEISEASPEMIISAAEDDVILDDVVISEIEELSIPMDLPEADELYEVEEETAPPEKKKKNKKRDKIKEPAMQVPEEKKKEEKESRKKEKAAKKEKIVKKAVTEKPAKKSRADKPAKQKPEKQEEQKHDAKPVSSVRLTLVLTVICAAVALLLASVNHFTEAKIAENTEKVMLASIREVFDDSINAKSVAVPEDFEFTSLYLVIKDGGVCGYAASVSPAGFGGPLNLMVGVDSAGTVMGVEIVSMSETPGLGSRVGGEEFLSQFNGKSGEVAVDAISGATISSKAVAEGVNTVTADPLDLDTLAAGISMLVVPYVPAEASPETVVPETEPAVTEESAVVPDVPVTDPPETEGLPIAPEVSKGDAPPEIIVENPNDENPGIHAEYEADTEEYETLTTEPESSELTETDAE